MWCQGARQSGGTVGIFSRSSGSESRASVRRPGDLNANLHLLGGPQWEDLEVAGESYHSKEIGRLFRSWGLTEGGVTMRVATLVPEPTNRYDKNAVKVLVDGSLVGYVPAADAPGIKAKCARVPRGKVAACSVRMWAKRDGGTWPARVTLAFSGSSEPERDFSGEEASQREEERRWDASHAAGKVHGAWWGQQRGAVAELKRQGRLEEALALVDECSAAAERVAAVLGERPEPWPAEQQSVILRKLKDPARELAALERYAHACGSFAVPDTIGERLNRARVAAGVSGEHSSEARVESSNDEAHGLVAEAAPRPGVEAPAPLLPAAAWYPDPSNPAILRWWDGLRWTEHTAPTN